MDDNKKYKVTLDGRSLNIDGIDKPTVKLVKKEQYGKYSTIQPIGGKIRATSPIPVLINELQVSLIGEKNDDECLRYIKSEMERIIGSLNPISSQHVEVAIKHDNSFISVTPCNLYTFLQMNNVPVPFHLVENADDWVTPDGLYKHKKTTNAARETVYTNEFIPALDMASLRKKRYNHHD